MPHNESEEDTADKPSEAALLEESKKPTLGELIHGAVSQNDRKVLNSGDVATILDLEDLGQTLTVPSRHLFHESKVLEQRAKPFTTTETGRVTGPRYMFLPEAAGGNAQDMPKLGPVLSTQTLDEIKGSGRELYKPVDHKNVKIKEEDDDNDEDQESGVKSSPDWIKAYETLLCAITGAPHRRFFEKHASTALPQIETFITVAESLDALPILTNTFNSLVLSFIANGSLWKGIAEEAVSWLLLSLKIKELNVFKEAFRHLAGSYPNWQESWRSKSSMIPQAILQGIESKSLQHIYFRMGIDRKLLTISLRTADGRLVSQKNNVIAYHTVNLWRDWIGERMNYLEDSAERGRVVDNNNKLEEENLTMAGFYRTIGRGGDAYLSPDKLLARDGAWNKEEFSCKDSQVRAALSEVKGKAAEMVRPLLKSGLQYGERDGLAYLTCIEPRKEDIPWVVDDGEDVLMEEEV